jgi:hypothetical protein
MLKKYLLPILLTAVTSKVINAQIVVGATPYITLKSAFDAINTGTHTGAVVINISGNTTENATAVLQASGVGAASYSSVLIKPITNGVTISGDVPGALINLNGADNVTIDGSVGMGTTRELTLKNNNVATLSAVIRMTSTGTGAGAINNTITRCNIQAGINTASLNVYGIYIGGTNISQSGTGADNDNITITKNSIKKANVGIYCKGASFSNPNTGISIQENIIGADSANDFITINGIEMTNSANVNISKNMIYNIIASHNAVIRAINLSAGVSNVTINANEISRIKNILTTASFAGQGIFISSLFTSNSAITNNAIYEIAGGSGAIGHINNQWGIIVDAGNVFSIYNNTITMTNSALPGSILGDYHGGILLVNATGLNIRNNNIFVTMLPSNVSTGYVCGIYNAVTSTANITDINYNNYYGTGDRFIVGHYISPKKTLTDWRNATTKDANSMSVNPLLASFSTNLRVGTLSACLNAGTSIGTPTLDIDGNIRDATPAIGAYETPLDFYDAKLAIGYTLGKLAIGYSNNHIIKAVITNSGNQNLNNINVALNISGSNTFSDIQNIAFLATGDSAVVSFAPFTPITTGTNTLTISIPNDELNSNNIYFVEQQVTANAIAYSFGEPAFSGIGWSSNGGNIVSKFKTSSAAVLKQAILHFSTNNVPFQLIVTDATGTGGTPGNFIFISPTMSSTVGERIITLSPGIVLPPGDFYLGVSQTSGINIGLGTHVEEPCREGIFYSRYWEQVTSWKDLATSRYKLMIEPRFELANNVLVAAAPPSGTEYFASGTTEISMVGSVTNIGANTANFVVTRKIRLASDNTEVYSNTQMVNSLAANSNTSVNFSPFTNFISGTNYRIKDSTFLLGDLDNSNDTTGSIFQPIIAKQNLIFWADAPSRDSLIAHFDKTGIGSLGYDIVPVSGFTGSFKPWRTVFYLLQSGNSGIWSAAIRDSLKAFLDDANPSVKKSLGIFGNNIGYNYDPIRNTSAAVADTIFYRQYLRGRYLGDNWHNFFHLSVNKFKGLSMDFAMITNDSINDPFPDLVKPVNGGEPAFIPFTESGNGDTCNAVQFANANYRVFYGTNVYANYKSKNYELLPFTYIYSFLNEALVPLPVTIASVKAYQHQTGIKVDWSSATENGLEKYEVEKSVNGRDFTTVGTVAAKGNSNIASHYSWYDAAPFAGTNYYRIKATSYNREVKYTNIVTVKMGKGPGTVSVYPNPVKGNVVNLQFDSMEKGNYTVTLQNGMGQIMLSKQINHIGGSATQSFELQNNLAKGVYRIRITNGTFNTVISLVRE